MPDQTQEDRTVLVISGSDSHRLMQDLVTNDMADLEGRLVYAALLSPQGKYLFDFFLTARGDDILLDVQSDQAAALAPRLSMYKLRSDMSVEASDITVTRGLGEAPKGALADPRHESLGWRSYVGTAPDSPAPDWNAIRVAACIPQTGIELIANDTYILEAGFERLNGVDFRKGCYVGQEVTARMKHKTELRKGLTTVGIDGPANTGDEITADGKVVGKLHTRAGDQAIAYLRFDRVADEMQARDARITMLKS